MLNPTVATASSTSSATVAGPVAISISSAAVAGPAAISSLAEAKVASNMLTSEQRLIAAELQIPLNMLRTGAPLSLQANYARYLVYLEACQTLASLKNAGTWPSDVKIPSSMDVVLLFIGKSAWYNLWSKAFPNVTKYPEMVKWLKFEDDRQSDVDIWGIAQNVYNFLHLITWIENGGSLIVETKPKKEKGKEKVSHKAKAGSSSKAGRK